MPVTHPAGQGTDPQSRSHGAAAETTPDTSRFRPHPAAAAGPWQRSRRSLALPDLLACAQANERAEWSRELAGGRAGPAKGVAGRSLFTDAASAFPRARSRDADWSKAPLSGRFVCQDSQ